MKSKYLLFQKIFFLKNDIVFILWRSQFWIDKILMSLSN